MALDLLITLLLILANGVFAGAELALDLPEGGGWSTVAGLMVSLSGGIPRPGARIKVGEVEIEVVEAKPPGGASGPHSQGCPADCRLAPRRPERGVRAPRRRAASLAGPRLLARPAEA